MKHRPSRTRVRGFSVVEMAVVILLVGIGFTLTLKGAVLIEVARAFWAGYEVQLFQRRVQLYGVQFHYLPGDDPNAAARYGHPQAAVNEDGRSFNFLGDSRINGKLSDMDNPLGEQFMAWRDLRYARLLDGDPTLAGAAARPTNPFGGVYGFDEGNLGQKNGSICLTNVTGGAAQRIDKSLDDGIINQGEVVATSKYDESGAKNHFNEPDSAPYDVEKTYIVCIPLRP